MITSIVKVASVVPVTAWSLCYAILKLISHNMWVVSLYVVSVYRLSGVSTPDRTKMTWYMPLILESGISLV